EDGNIAIRRLLFRAGLCAWTEIADKFCQRCRPSRVGHENLVTGIYQMTTEGLGDFSGAYEAYSHCNILLLTRSEPAATGLRCRSDALGMPLMPSFGRRSFDVRIDVLLQRL